MKKILILGRSGMLGSMVYDYLKRTNMGEIRGTLRPVSGQLADSVGDDIIFFDAEKDTLEQAVYPYFKPDYIINCIGIIKPYCKDDDMSGVLKAITVNALFPHILAASAKKIGARVIQIATDCVYSGIRGGYTENDPHDALDVYGKTKSLGEVKDPSFLNVRCSIIGPELKNELSLLEWFLHRSAGEVVNGYSHHHWNGVTTLQFGQVCEQIIKKGEAYFDELTVLSPVHHLILNKAVSKFELLNIFNDVFKKGLSITEVGNVGNPVDRTIGTVYSLLSSGELLPMEESIKELKKYIEETEFNKN